MASAVLSSDQPPPTPTTDFALIESQKENIRPLATGRSAATLSALFEKDAEGKKVLEEGHERYMKLIDEAERRDREGEDMLDEVVDLLDAYHQHIQWAAQHFTSRADYFIEHCEKATRRFVKDTRYAQDARYLKMWLLYSRYMERREEIWAFLASREICTNHALFYEEWAIACEGLGRKKKADEIFRLGLARRAAPIERLKSRHQQYLQRILASSSQDIPDDEPLAPVRSAGRSVLGQVDSAASVSGATQLAPANRISRGTNGSKMEIFADTQASGGQDDAPSEWADLGTRDARRKENVVEATPWKGETMPQKSFTPRTPKIGVFQDLGDNKETIKSAEEALFKPKAQTLAEMLRADPLRHYDTSSVASTLPTMPAPPTTRRPPKPKAAAAFHVPNPWTCPNDGPLIKDARGKGERRMFNWDAVYKNGEEWSFEEVRARERGLLGKEWRGEVKEWERAWHQAGSSTPRPVEKARKPPSPTVNTKLANAEIAAMFDQTIHGGKSRGSRGDDSDSDMDESDDDEEDAIHCAPTPLPARAGASMMSSLGAPGSFVPPTPTPAQGHVAQHRSAAPMVFSDENAVPASASKPARLNVFSETPAKTPLAARTPLSVTSTKTKIFEDVQEEAEPSAENDENAAPPSSSSRPANNIFSTPAFKAPVRRNIFSNAIAEEAEEEDGEAQDRPLDHVVENADEYIPESDENDWARMRHVGGGFNIMTPISERTQEFTQMTNLRSSQGTNIFSTSSGRRSSVKSIYQDGDDGMVEAPATAVLPALEAVREEEERTSAREQSTTPEDSPMIHFSDDSVPPFENSGNDPARFVLPEGYTIHRTDAMQHTMVLTDRDRDTMQTMHTAKEGSPEPTSNTDTEAFVTANHGDLDVASVTQSLPNPCVPTDEEVVTKLLSMISPPLSAMPHIHDLRHTTSNRLNSLQSHCKSRARRSSTTPRQSISADDNVSVALGDRDFEVSDKIGEGGFGAVFLAVDVRLREQIEDADSDDEDNDDDDDELDRSLVAIKVEKPCAVWEAVILDRIHSRLDATAASSIIRPRDLYAFADESYLVLDFASQGTLLDAVNKAASMGIAPATTGAPSALDELVAVFFTIELLRLVESMHRARFIHGDLKIDNCLVRLEAIPSAEGGASSWSAQYDASGQNGWRHKGIKLIDFGRAIDLSLFPAGDGQKFKADWPIDERDCLEIRENREWSFEADYHGLASICHCMLFGKYISTEVAADGRWHKIATPLKRYWQTELWTKLFDTLLNPQSAGRALPFNDHLRDIRVEFETWLEGNCQKGGKSLRSMLKKIELAAITGRR